MSDVTRILNAIEQGDEAATDTLLPLVYDELRQLAAQKLSQERPDHTLQATALVHEAYLRLLGQEASSFNNRNHFFGAAAKAMRRILVDRARSKKRLKRGGGHRRIELNDACIAVESAPDTLLILDEALTRLSNIDSEAAKLIQLCFFGGLTLEQGAEVLGVSLRTAYRYWAFARAWLYDHMAKEDKAEASA
ncbi:MAG: sigma-70 family RNA polymerase sigma factor [Phycisphaerae bacterium]|nr:sigma-70 family RNA polymerase sigma factor [Phycisphaerae bacterium]